MIRESEITTGETKASSVDIKFIYRSPQGEIEVTISRRCTGLMKFLEVLDMSGNTLIVEDSFVYVFIQDKSNNSTLGPITYYEFEQALKTQPRKTE